jgi:hypothetical protein
MKDKSMINMAGTSMGSYDKPMMKGGYDKPMMKGSGLMMKCGCQIGKHMGGPKMMGGDDKKNPMKKAPSAHQSKIDANYERADKIAGAMKQKMDGTGSPDINLARANYYLKSHYGKAKDLEKKGPYAGIDLSKKSEFGTYAPSKQPKFTDGTRLGEHKTNPRTGKMILPDLGPVAKTLTKKESRKKYGK